VRAQMLAARNVPRIGVLGGPEEASEDLLDPRRSGAYPSTSWLSNSQVVPDGNGGFTIIAEGRLLAPGEPASRTRRHRAGRRERGREV
jgi:hypothetical protein